MPRKPKCVEAREPPLYDGRPDLHQISSAANGLVAAGPVVLSDLVVQIVKGVRRFNAAARAPVELWWARRAAYWSVSLPFCRWSVASACACCVRCPERGRGA